MLVAAIAVILHPASFLLAWMAAAVALQQLALPGLLFAAIVIVPCALLFAPTRTWHMIRRSRWLLLSLLLLFAFGTPGRVVPGLPWLTVEGLQLASEHVMRLGLLLVLLALLLQRLHLDRLMSGLYLLLAPAAALGFDRRKAVARLMLVIDYVQRDETRSWREWLAPTSAEQAPAALMLALTPIRGADYAAIILLGVGVAAAVATSA